MNDGEFVGTDFNPSQVAIAKLYGDRENLTLYNDSFSQLLERFEREKPQFDYIVLHGIFSWVSQENRKIILEIISRFLKVGGVVYNSYNCMPGWSPKIPSREILLLYKSLYATATMDTDGLVKGAIGFFEEFLSTMPNYAEESPQNKKMLADLKTRDTSYIPHEYLNQDWDCFYFYKVAQMLEGAKCTYATSGNYLEHFDMWNLKPEAIAMLEKIQHRIFREQLKDYCINRQFRKDIYIKGARKITQREIIERICNTYFTLIAPISEFKEKLGCPLGELNLHKDLYIKVLKFLEKDDYREKSAKEIMEACDMEISAALQVLCVLGTQRLVAPTQKASETLKCRANAYNMRVLARQEIGNNIFSYLAVAKIASGIVVSNVEQLIMSAYFKGARKESELVRFVMAIFKDTGRNFLKDGKMLESEAENKKAIAEVVKEFLGKLPLYKALEILDS
ncbi:MAG: class I SAM-dependent methyltransferase [Lachnospiraceae bacterium]|nr:class I SAM-dependent methyltransferase [Lachnospiraceae bacterium]